MSVTSNMLEQDRVFELSIQRLPDYQFFCECKFTPGNAKKRGRKPCPDGVLKNLSTNEVFYLEMKRPSECAVNSWLNSYKGDRFPRLRKSVHKLHKEGFCTKQMAEACAIIAEHDEHMSVYRTRWNDPLNLGGWSAQRNVIALPCAEDLRVGALRQMLEYQGRYIREINYDCAILLFYSKLLNWRDAELTRAQLPHS